MFFPDWIIFSSGDTRLSLNSAVFLVIQYCMRHLFSSPLSSSPFSDSSASSSAPQTEENILLCIRENPGITQKQITGTVRCSRGSVCYHLHQLEKTGKIRKLHLGTTPQYYPSAELPSPDTLIEQTILLLLSRKKSGRFLRTLYEHPGITQKELAALLNIRPTTAHWYLHTYTKSRILSVEQNGRERHYSLTREAETICARLIPDTQNP